MKYIVITCEDKKKDSVMRFPIIFPNSLVHEHVSRVMCLLLSLMFLRHEVKATSAGEINSMDFSGMCHGKSDTLQLKSNSVEDTQLVRMNDYGSGMM